MVTMVTNDWPGGLGGGGGGWVFNFGGLPSLKFWARARACPCGIT